MLLHILNTVTLENCEKDKFERIYYKYRNVLFSSAFNIVMNKYDAEDVLQNSFIKIARNIEKIGDINSKETAAFLMIITKNTAFDFLKKGYKKIEMPIEEDTLSEEDILEDLLSRLEYEKIVRVIRGLKPPYNEVLYLHFVNDFSVKQTSKLLNRKEKTVKMQIVRGKKILISKFSEELYE